MNTAGYTIVYIEILVLCIVYSLVILLRTSADLGTNREVRIFRIMMSVFIGMLVLDGFCQLQYRDVISPPLITVALGYAVYQFCLSLLSVMWLFFVEYQIHDGRPLGRRIATVACLPLVPVAVLAIGSLWNNWLFSFDAAGHFVRGPWFLVLNIVSYAYFFAASAHALYAWYRSRGGRKKRRMLLLSTFIISPVIGATLQLFVGIHPFVPPSVCISFVFIFINIQGDQINADALTGLNNRKSMEQYLDDIRPLASQDNPWYFYILDADRFKTINDTRGHAEGDRALKIIADALRDAAESFHGFIARFGGDEFVAVIEGSQMASPEDFAQTVRESLSLICREKKIMYPLTASVGYTKLTAAQTATSELIAKADQMLYEKKKALREKT